MRKYPHKIPKHPGLYEIRKGVYKRVVYVGLNYQGKERQRSRTFTAPNDSAAAKIGEEKAVEMRKLIVAPPATVAELVRRWEAAIGSRHSATTRRGREYLLRAIERDLGAIKLSALNAHHVDMWMADLRRAGKANTTVSNHHAMLRTLLIQGAKWKLPVDLDAVKDATPPKRVGNREVGPPTMQAFRVLLDKATPDLRIAAALAGMAGLRRGEVCALRWRDVDVATGVIHVRQSSYEEGGERLMKLPKSNRTRRVEFGDELRGLLLAHAKHQTDTAARLGGRISAAAYVVADLPHDSTGRMPRRVGWLTLAWSRLGKKEGTPVRFHDLRHLAATTLIDQGVPLSLVQTQLGHAQMSTTIDIYGHALPAAGRVGSALDAAFRAAAEAP